MKTFHSWSNLIFGRRLDAKRRKIESRMVAKERKTMAGVARVRRVKAANKLLRRESKGFIRRMLIMAGSAGKLHEFEEEYIQPSAHPIRAPLARSAGP